MTDHLTYDLLGGLTVRRDGASLELGGPKQRAVLAALLLADGHPVPADRLVDLVWGEDAPARAEASLQTYISHLRRVLEPGRGRGEGPSVLVTRSGGYALVASEAQVDLRSLERRLADGLAAAARGDRAVACANLSPVADGWPPLLPELDTPVVVARRARLAEQRASALAARADAELADGRAEAALPGLVAAVAEQPRHERLRALLVLALYRSGRQADALAALDDARRWLRDEAGLEPGPELRRLEADVLAQARHLDLPAPLPPVGPPSWSMAPSAAEPAIGSLVTAARSRTPFDRDWARPTRTAARPCTHHRPRPDRSARPCRRRIATGAGA